MCTPEVHAAVADALASAARQPVMAAELAGCAAFWALQRLLRREDLPAALKQRGQRVVQAVEQALVAESGEAQQRLCAWGTLTVLSSLCPLSDSCAPPQD